MKKTFMNELAQKMGLQIGDEIAIGDIAYCITCLEPVTGILIVEHGHPVVSSREYELDLRLGWQVLSRKN